MNTREYIESGVLEAYILGALTGDEEALVEANIAQFPELADELLAIEAAMNEFASTFAKAPPAGLEERILGAIDIKSDTGNQQTAAPKIIPFQPEYRKPVQWKYAAVWLALFGSVGTNLFLWNQGRHGKDENTALSYKMDKLQSDQKQLAGLVADYQKNKSMMADTGMQTIVMHTMQKGHPMAATLYWSKEKGVAYVSVDALPEPPQGMQYQLWAIQGGKPVDMGVLPNNMANTPAMQKVDRPVTGGEAFAISLEKAGGSPSPTMENIYVMGKPS